MNNPEQADPKHLPDPSAMATTEEEIAALFGVQPGESLMLAEGMLLVVITPEGKVIWVANGKELDPEMVAKILALMMKAGVIKGILHKLAKAKVTTTSPPSLHAGQPSQTVHTPPHGSGKGGISR